MAFQLGVGWPPGSRWLSLRVELNCCRKMVQADGTFVNHVIDRAGLAIRGTLGSLETFAKSSFQI